MNSTTVQKYYRAPAVMLKRLIGEEVITTNPLAKIGVTKAEKKVIKALSGRQVAELVDIFGKTFEDTRNKAIILVMVDCGLRLGELLNLKRDDVRKNGQLLKVDGKTGERVVRFGSTTAKALSRYLAKRDKVAECDSLWIIKEGTALKDSSVETMFINLSRRTGIDVHPHLLRHAFAALWLKNGGDSLMLQRSLGHTTLMMTTRYVQAVRCYDAIESHKKYSPVDRLG